MAICLLSTITLWFPYNGHIPGIFLDVYVILLIQLECATAQTGPQLQTTIFGPIDEGHEARCSLSAMKPASPVFAHLRLPTRSPAKTFGVHAVLSSRTFGDRSEGGVPNRYSSPDVATSLPESSG